jgi:hypothetical protein
LNKFRRTNEGHNDGNIIACNAPTTMALQLAMLLLLQRCDFVARNTVVATALELATLLLLQRCCCYGVVARNATGDIMLLLLL